MFLNAKKGVLIFKEMGNLFCSDCFFFFKEIRNKNCNNNCIIAHVVQMLVQWLKLHVKFQEK